MKYEDIVNKDKNVVLIHLYKLTEEIREVLNHKRILTIGDLTMELLEDKSFPLTPYPTNLELLKWEFKVLGARFGAYTALKINRTEEDFNTIIHMVLYQIVDTLQKVKKDLEKYDYKYILKNHSHIRIDNNNVESSISNPFGLGNNTYHYSNISKYNNMYVINVLSVEIPQITSYKDNVLSIEEMIEQRKYTYSIKNLLFTEHKIREVNSDTGEERILGE